MHDDHWSQASTTSGAARASVRIATTSSETCLARSQSCARIASISATDGAGRQRHGYDRE